jgi:hypothetical protein
MILLKVLTKKFVKDGMSADLPQAFLILVTDEGDQLHRQVKEPPVPNGPRSLS